MNSEYYELGTSRAGAWDPSDLFMGGLMALLVMEYARKRHMPLFVLNILLIFYAVYGWLVPGMFHHAGLSWSRVVTAMSVENTTGVFSNLPQIALTIIGSFLLVLSVLNGYGCIESLLRATKRVAARSAHALPQSAVVGSMCVGTVSGSGAANAITIGSATIPAMIGAGMPRATAAAIESASSLGGQLMPPVMGVSAFLMAEFLGRSYFDVVARGYVPALIYYATVAVSVYLLAVRHRTRLVAISFEALTWRDWVNLAAFLARDRRPGRDDGGLASARRCSRRSTCSSPSAACCSCVNLVPLLAPGRWSFGGIHRADPEISRFLHRDDVRSDAAPGDAVDHDRRARHHRRSDQARLAADRGGRFQSRGHGHSRLRVRRIARDRPAAGSDLHPGRHRDRAADDQRRRRSVGRCISLRSSSASGAN